jgi:hypothetical protein
MVDTDLKVLILSAADLPVKLPSQSDLTDLKHAISSSLPVVRDGFQSPVEFSDGLTRFQTSLAQSGSVQKGLSMYPTLDPPVIKLNNYGRVVIRKN